MRSGRTDDSLDGTARTMTVNCAPSPRRTVWARTQSSAPGAVRGDRGAWRVAIAAAGAAGASGGACVPGLWLEQAHPDQPPVVIDALDEVSVQLEFGRRRRPGTRSRRRAARQKRPAGRRPGAVAPAAAVAGGQPASSTGLSPSSEIGEAAEVSGPRCWHLTFSDWGLVAPQPTARAAVDYAVRSRRVAWRRWRAPEAEAQVARIT